MVAMTEIEQGTFVVPTNLQFEELWDGTRAPFRPAPDIEYRADVLIGRYDELAELEGHPIRYLWGRAVKKRRGATILGYTYLHNAELRWLTECEATIVLCGNAMQQFNMDDHQIEGTLYHELKHLGVKNGKLGTRDHDVYMFYDEIRRYGLYLEKLKAVGEVVEQAALPLDVLTGGRA